MSMLAITINDSTGLSISLVASLIVTIVSCSVWIVKKLSALTSRVDKLEADHYTRSEAAENALRFAIANPGLSVPDPRNPDKVIVVNGSDE